VSLDPHDGALWALVAICLVLVGAVITPGQVGIDERGAILAAIAAVLLAIGWRIRRRNGGDHG
jgi:drug/metabolite transporter (DMT)-like permease